MTQGRSIDISKISHGYEIEFLLDVYEGQVERRKLKAELGKDKEVAKHDPGPAL